MKKLTTKEFIEKAIGVHGDKYGYNKVMYINNYTKIEIYCKKHNKYFLQTPMKHLMGRGCITCGTEYRIKKCVKNKKRFIFDAIIVHGDKYGYDKVEYNSNHEYVQIYCNTCNKYFLQTPNKHLVGRGCKRCGINKRVASRTKNTEQFIVESINIHGDKYGYDKVVYIKYNIKVNIYCKQCKKYFLQLPGCHSHGVGCPKCRESKGEKEISKILDTYYIDYIPQKRFEGCRYKNTLPFDFYLPEYNICIEYQGEQHYKPINGIYHKTFTINEKTELFKSIKKRDKIKKEYCKNNNIKLLEIPYWDFKNIEKIIKDKICIYKYM